MVKGTDRVVLPGASCLYRIIVSESMHMIWCTRCMWCTLHSPPFSDGLSPDPANSNGPSRQSVRLPTDSVGLDQIPLLVRSKSGESPVKSP